MRFDTLLGNDRLKQNLAESLAKNHISHFYLISGPAGSGKKTLAKLLAQAILCQGRHKPCGTCEPCRKIQNGNHPDLITVEDPEHKNVAVKIVRAFREDVFIRPNESDYKIYLFPQDLGTEGQNALLKILEEPPGYGVFILLTDNPEKILPTVRSRCTELKMQSLPQNLLKSYLAARFPDAAAEEVSAAAARSGGFLGQALELLESGGAAVPQTEQFVHALCRRDAFFCQCAHDQVVVKDVNLLKDDLHGLKNLCTEGFRRVFGKHDGELGLRHVEMPCRVEDDEGQVVGVSAVKEDILVGGVGVHRLAQVVIGGTAADFVCLDEKR